MKNILVTILFLTVGLACNVKNEGPSKDGLQNQVASSSDSLRSKGIGAYETVELNDPLNQAMVVSGKKIYEMRCSACHKLKGSRLVGPSWAGLTSKREPEWIMNMITNVEVMLDQDPTAQKLLEECLTRMPNQNISEDEARSILEFMFQIDIDYSG